MFSGCNNLSTLNIQNFNTSSIENMSAMFSSCSSLVTLDLTHFSTSLVKDMSYMFSNCSKLSTLIIDESFDTSSVKDISYMFKGCSTLTELDLSNFNTSSATNMKYMFMESKALTTIYVSDLWKTDNVTDSANMFNSCTSLVGGAGTTYDSNHRDKEYARIDEGTENPGYFTSKNS